jgi:hypothetical protein
VSSLFLFVVLFPARPDCRLEIPLEFVFAKILEAPRGFQVQELGSCGPQVHIGIDAIDVDVGDGDGDGARVFIVFVFVSIVITIVATCDGLQRHVDAAPLVLGVLKPVKDFQFIGSDTRQEDSSHSFVFVFVVIDVIVVRVRVLVLVLVRVRVLVCVCVRFLVFFNFNLTNHAGKDMSLHRMAAVSGGQQRGTGIHFRKPSQQRPEDVLGHERPVDKAARSRGGGTTQGDHCNRDRSCGFVVSMFRCFDVSLFRCFDVTMFRIDREIDSTTRFGSVRFVSVRWVCLMSSVNVLGLCLFRDQNCNIWMSSSSREETTRKGEKEAIHKI